MGQTLFDKIWEKHVVDTIEDDLAILYIDCHFIHEVTSPQAFSALRKRGLKVLRPNKTVATMDHNVPTVNQSYESLETASRLQLDELKNNCDEFGIQLFSLGHENNGIVHVIGPELGITQPGMTIVCGDSHTSTHGAFGCIAFGIGTSEIEQVLLTQSLLQTKPRNMKVEINGELQKGVTAKDVILHIISKLGVNGGTGYFVEFSGNVISNMSMESRMTLCNMSIELGARGGLIAPDKITFDYLKKTKQYQKTQHTLPEDKWKNLYSDKDAEFDKTVSFKAEEISPMITYGTNPGMAIPVNLQVPDFVQVDGSGDDSYKKALQYMGFKTGEELLGKKITNVFIGSCTNARIEDLRSAATFVKGSKVAPWVKAIVVPGSNNVYKTAVAEGLDKIFTESGFEFRLPGCSSCLSMNGDTIPAGEYCLSTSNRNFEGRQGPGARTILVSPGTAAVSAIQGKISDVRSYMN